jgi:hypothetical protein
MSKLYDEVMSGLVDVRAPRWIREVEEPPSPGAGLRMLQKLIRGAVVYDVTNVSDYYFGGTDQEWFDPTKDFSCVRPVFSHFWMEFSKPKKVKSVLGGELKNFKFPFDRVGVLGRVLDVDDPEVLRFTAREVGAERKHYLHKKGAVAKNEYVVEKMSREILEAKVLVHFSSFMEENRVVVGPQQHTYVWLREDGSVIDFDMNVEVVPGFAGPLEGETQGFENFTFPALMALDMIHTRNVRVFDFVPPPKLQRAHAKRRGTPMVSWKTITILPFVERRRPEDEEPKVGTGSRPWRIVPGHYAHYGIVGPGGWIRGKLFGKVSGRFWIPESESGSEEAGIIVKDYRMAPPDAEPKKRRKK